MKITVSREVSEPDRGFCEAIDFVSILKREDTFPILRTVWISTKLKEVGTTDGYYVHLTTGVAMPDNLVNGLYSVTPTPDGYTLERFDTDKDKIYDDYPSVSRHVHTVLAKVQTSTKVKVNKSISKSVAVVTGQEVHIDVKHLRKLKEKAVTLHTTKPNDPVIAEYTHTKKGQRFICCMQHMQGTKVKVQ